MTSKISLYDLYEIKKKKDTKVNEAFNVILTNCHNKIKNIAEIGGQSLYFKIPPIVIGYPLYNHSKCINYIISSLQNSGLFVSLLTDNNMIYISWKIDDIKETQKYLLLK
jgi:hypothetical protein